VSQKIEDKADAAEARTQQTRGFMQQVRVDSKAKKVLDLPCVQFPQTTDRPVPPEPGFKVFLR